MSRLYVHFFHGRENKDDNMDDWGFDGPIVGPVHVGWTYGSVKLTDDTGNLHEIVTDGDLVVIDNKYYGDYSVLPEDNDAVVGAKEKSNELEMIDLETFITLNKI